MDAEYENTLDENAEPVRVLTKGQRRVLGVLVEKALTTPDQYPLTLKAATSGANQKSNRDPVTSYSENAVWDLLDQLRELGLIAVVHTESGRTERFRHYVRKRYPFTEPQLAIITELMLRGKQQLGELRSRASRMVSIDSLDQLRRELASLVEQGYVRSNGPLERRGIEVDHNLYPAGEQKPSFETSVQESVGASPSPASASPATPELPRPSESGASGQETAELKATVESLKSELEELKASMEIVQDDLAQLRTALGV
ncbi:hypothetical protein KOR42_25900 [Thalassoglobus neptunius]|uniref:DUF480 domain-containing protein n=2 Tax=Thalassoglobus neptunius TaxID=1938619 RepID=A0A5C5WZQ4_9PLAN|nr:hypothetical protein KOR42_25900 [Thalassoglobus neptunius]